MTRTFRTRRITEFRDTDAAGIVHFTSFFGYMESVEHEFFRSLGVSVIWRDGQGATISWPRVAVRCDYQRPVRFEDALEIELSILRLGAKSATFQHLFQCQGQPAAVGQITAVCCRIDRSPPLPVEIPDTLRALLAQYVAPDEAQSAGTPRYSGD